MTFVYKFSDLLTIYIYTCYCSDTLSQNFSYFDQVHVHQIHRVVILQFFSQINTGMIQKANYIVLIS